MENLIPHNLLPIVRPLEDTTQYNETYFYENVIQPLIKDIVQMEANGIPIDLKKVAKLETTVDDVLGEVHRKLANNDMMLDFLKSVAKEHKKAKTEEEAWFAFMQFMMIVVKIGGQGETLLVVTP